MEAGSAEADRVGSSIVLGFIMAVQLLTRPGPNQESHDATINGPTPPSGSQRTRPTAALPEVSYEGTKSSANENGNKDTGHIVRE